MKLLCPFCGCVWIKRTVAEMVAHVLGCLAVLYR